MTSATGTAPATATATTSSKAAPPRGVVGLIKATFKSFGEDECGTRAAALAYSAIFALPPLLIVIVTIAGKIWGPDQVQASLEHQFSSIIGPSAAKAIHDMIAHGQQSKGRGTLATVLGIAGLLLGATGAFLALQDALNHAWEVKPDPKRGGVKPLIFKRLLSLGMVLGLGFLVAVSLALSAGIAAVTSSFGTAIPSGVMYAIDLIVSLVVLGTLFALMLKVLPDGKIAWKPALVGGLTTAILFVIGKFAIGLYLGHSKPGDSFGAASAFAVIVVWIYYAGMIVLLGAEFTQAWARGHGHEIVPREGAVRVVRVEETGSGGRSQLSDDGGGPAIPTAAAQSGRVKKWVLALPFVYWIMRRSDRS
jgi:membrane protein